MNDADLAAWQRGRTGYPIVDAGMRELWSSGIMHNRVRMIVASFLIKDLLIPWQAGERWFWDTLVDADIASNAASWQWVAGCGRRCRPLLSGSSIRCFRARSSIPSAPMCASGCRSSPASRPFVHRPWDAPALVLQAAGVELGRNYPHPLIDHGMARDKALAAFKAIRERRGMNILGISGALPQGFDQYGPSAGDEGDGAGHGYSRDRPRCMAFRSSTRMTKRRQASRKPCATSMPVSAPPTAS